MVTPDLYLARYEAFPALGREQEASEALEKVKAERRLRQLQTANQGDRGQASEAVGTLSGKSAPMVRGNPRTIGALLCNGK